MAVGTLIVSRAVNLFSDIKKKFSDMGYRDVTVTAAEKDGLYSLIDELKPRLVMMDCQFHKAGTPYMMGELLKRFPKQNTAVYSEDDFPLDLAVFFICHGVKSFVRLWDGTAEYNKGLKQIREGYN